jgi:hypothetical protein
VLNDQISSVQMQYISDLRDWNDYNEALVQRGLIFIDSIAKESKELP